MVDTDKVFAGEIPDIYDTYLVPLIFEVYAADLAARVAEIQPMHVLETASGSGVVTRALAPLLPENSTYFVTDLNQPMLDRAAKMQALDNRITWQQTDALSLPFEDDSFDVVCCQFGVMFFPDKVAGYREAKRVLKPGGRFIFNTWDRIEENVFAHVVTETASNVFPDDPPLFLARTPHGYHDREKIEGDVKSAGFSDIEIVTIDAMSTAQSPSHPAIAYCQGTPLRNEIEQRDPDKLGDVTEMATSKIADLYGQGEVSAKIQGHVVTAIV